MNSETVKSGRSNFETVAGVFKRVLNLKQNRSGHCFKIPALVFSRTTVSCSGPGKSRWL
jgi:hypothetical protein